MPPLRRRGCLLAAVLVGASVAGCSGSESAAGDSTRFVQVKPGYDEVAVAKRKMAPELSGTTLTDVSFALDQLRGKVVVVNFWGSWCPPCRAEAPALETVAKATAADGVQFVGVDERESKTNALSFIRDHGISYPSLSDDDGSLAASWPAAAGPPYTFIIDRKGKIAARFLGGITSDELSSAVQKVTAEA